MTEPHRKKTLERTLTQDDFNAFAQLSGDDNPIHVDPAHSARTSFGRTVSHGMLLYSVMRGLADEFAPGAQQLSKELKFPAPAYADEPLRFDAEVVSEDDNTIALAMTAVRIDGEVAVCEASCVLEKKAG